MQNEWPLSRAEAEAKISKEQIPRIPDFKADSFFDLSDADFG